MGGAANAVARGVNNLVAHVSVSAIVIVVPVVVVAVAVDAFVFALFVYSCI